MNLWKLDAQITEVSLRHSLTQSSWDKDGCLVGRFDTFLENHHAVGKDHRMIHKDWGESSQCRSLFLTVA
jgi:hypothetical protein